MSKFATKAAANMFCQARYEAAKSNERLSSREGAAEEIGIDRTRLARIELGSTIPYQEEVLLMADCYKAPELKGNYCREMCPLGKNMPKIENAGLDRISLRMLSSFKKINEATFAAGAEEATALKEAFASSKNFVVDITDASGAVTAVSQSAFADGADPTVTNADYSAGLKEVEKYYFNTICVDTEDAAVHALVAAFLDRIYLAGSFGMAIVTPKPSSWNHKFGRHMEELHIHRHAMISL